MKKFIVSCCCLLVLSACNQPNDAPKYATETVELKNILYTDWRKTKDAAIKQATNEMKQDAKAQCRRIDASWYLKEISKPGEMECEETSDGHRCKRVNVEMVCNALK